MYENRPYFEPKRNGNEVADIVADFAACMKRGDSPDSPAAQSAVEQWRACHNACCGGELLGVESIAFDVESYGTGTAKYMTDAIAFYKKGH